MRLRPEQLDGDLGKRLLPVYLLSGDEPLQLQEAADAIRLATRKQGYSERECLSVVPGFDWSQLAQAAASLSLFGERRLLELRLQGAKPGDAGSKALCAYAQRPPDDTVLLILGDKLDKSAQRSRWYTELDKIGAMIQVWPITGRQLPAWIERRLLQRGLRASGVVAALLAERVEGNLLAAAQEIEKLALLYGQGPLDEAQLFAAAGDHARYSIYDLVDAALAGQTARVIRIADGLREEGVEAILAFWALHREIALLTQLSHASGPLENALSQHKVWEKRKPLLRQAMTRLDRQRCYELLRHCAHLEQMIKGIRVGVPWDEMINLALVLAGRPCLPFPSRELQI